MLSASEPPQTQLTMALAGFGEAGQAYAKSLLKQGVRVHIYRPGANSRTQDAAAALGLTIGGDAGASLGAADVILSVVPGSAALEIARTCVRVMQPGAIFADLTSAAPATIRESASLFAADTYVDVAIMGAVSIHGHRTPLLASGVGAQRLQTMLQPLGFEMECLANSANGDATSLKLLRSVFTKGMDAVVMECLLAAEAAGLRKQLLLQMADLDRSTTGELIEMFVRTHVPAALRRLHEVRAVAEQLDDLGVDTFITRGAQRRYEDTVALLGEAARVPSTPAGGTIFDAVLPWMLEAKRASRVASKQPAK